MKIEHINEFANRCGHFFNACLELDVTVNNGYNCKHPEQEEVEDIDGKKIGKCHCWSCPLGFEADEEDFENPQIDKNGWDTHEEGEFIVVTD